MRYEFNRNWKKYNDRDNPPANEPVTNFERGTMQRIPRKNVRAHGSAFIDLLGLLIK